MLLALRTDGHEGSSWHHRRSFPRPATLIQSTRTASWFPGSAKQPPSCSATEHPESARPGCRIFSAGVLEGTAWARIQNAPVLCGLLAMRASGARRRRLLSSGKNGEHSVKCRHRSGWSREYACAVSARRAGISRAARTAAFSRMPRRRISLTSHDLTGFLVPGRQRPRGAPRPGHLPPAQLIASGTARRQGKARMSISSALLSCRGGLVAGHASSFASSGA